MLERVAVDVPRQEGVDVRFSNRSRQRGEGQLQVGIWVEPIDPCCFHEAGLGRLIIVGLGLVWSDGWPHVIIDKM